MANTQTTLNKPISFIYFDVGGVVIKDFSDSDKFIQLQKSIGVNSQNQKQFDDVWQSHRHSITIDYDIDNYVPILGNQLHLPLPSKYSLLDDFVNRFEQNKTIWPIVDLAQQNCRVGLLTNMYPRMFAEIEKAKLLPPVRWDIVIDSSVEKVSKPNQDIFVLAQTKVQCDPETILFIDNTQKHLDAAASLGWQTYFYDSSDYEQSSLKLKSYLASQLFTKSLAV